MDGRVAIVTGAARGTGEATARLLAAEGATVVVADLLAEQGAQVAKEIGGGASFQSLDVGDEDSWRALVDRVVADHGTVDALVNNAGVLLMAALEDTQLADYERVVRVNQIGPFLGMRTVAPVMRAAGRGSIVNVSSIDGMSTKNGLTAYSASKWAVRGMTRTAAIELGRYGIRVNAVCPEAGSAEMFRGDRRVLPAAHPQDPDEAPDRGEDRRHREDDRLPRLRRRGLVHGRRLPGGRRQPVRDPHQAGAWGLKSARGRSAFGGMVSSPGGANERHRPTHERETSR
jgi:3alpha(or 20beta)-hydroxysteroid dehydrogenase